MSYAPNSNYREQGGDSWVVGGEIDITGTFKVGSSSVSATADELNMLDLSSQGQTIIAAGAIETTTRNTFLDSTAGTMAVTLAAPSANMIGTVKIIEMVVDNGDVTLALTNVVGGSAATTATFSAVNQCLVLVGGTNKWHVIAESGVALT